MRKIYKPKCEDLDVKMNSGVKELLMTAPPCFCSLQAVNFRNFLLGNRGVQALWPILRYARALKSLNLAGNDIHDEGARFIITVLEADAANLGKDDVGSLVLVDLSKNPITGSLAEDLMRFNDKRKDVLMLGLANTMMPMAKRQRLLRQCLTKFAGVEPHVMLEAWRLANDPRDFVDRELFIQCERIVENIHGSAIHDMIEVGENSHNRRQGFTDDDDDWDDDFNFDDFNHPRASQAHLGQDGFGGLDEYDSLSNIAQADSARETPLGRFTPMSPTPPPSVARCAELRTTQLRKESQQSEGSQPDSQRGSGPYSPKGSAINSRQSWALRRRQASTPQPNQERLVSSQFF